MGKLDYDVLACAPSTLNPIGERELNLRGTAYTVLKKRGSLTLCPANKIERIENLSLTKVSLTSFNRYNRL
jgi:hypothetical protein